MHIGNRQWLDDLQARYGHIYAGGKVLELGALDWNGSARQSIRAALYVGVDRIAGPGVDVVSPAAATNFPGNSFDVIICTSMLEHDPRWFKSLSHNLHALKPEGLLFLSWGAEGNQHHQPEPWRPVLVGDVLEWAMDESLQIEEACWEKTRYHGDCAGCYDMVLRKRSR